MLELGFLETYIRYLPQCLGLYPVCGADVGSCQWESSPEERSVGSHEKRGAREDA